MPIQIIIEESKNEIIENINVISNKYNLNYYLLEIIVKDLYNEIFNKKEIELKQVREEYENSLKEDNNNG